MKKGLIAVIIAVVAVAGIATIVISHKKNTDKNNKAATTSGTSSSQQNSASSSTDMHTMNASNGGSSNTSTNNNATATDKVSIKGFAFTPSAITVKKGTTVTWTNNDSTEHTVTADSGIGPKSNALNQGDTYTFTYDTVGTFSYHCSFHSSMTGTVTVTE